MSWFLDGLALLFIVLLGVIGFKRGLIEEFGRLLGLIFAILISISNSTKFSVKVNDLLQMDGWACSFLSPCYLQ